MMERAMTAGQIRVVRGWAELMVVAWRRSWHFTGLFRRNSKVAMAASRSWSWQWAVVAWQACAQYPMNLIAVGWTAAEIWTATVSGSARSHRVDRRRRFTVAGLLLVMCTVVVLAAVILTLAVAGLTVSVVCVLVVALLLVWLVGLVMNAARPQPEGLNRLGRRARQLSDGLAVVVTDVVVGQQQHGDGLRLMRSMADQWTCEGIAVAVLYAGSDDLVTFYRDVVGGWALDEGSARRMIWTGQNG